MLPSGRSSSPETGRSIGSAPGTPLPLDGALQFGAKIEVAGTEARRIHVRHVGDHGLLALGDQVEKLFEQLNAVS